MPRTKCLTIITNRTAYQNKTKYLFTPSGRLGGVFCGRIDLNDSMVIQQTFLLFEASFCFLVSLFMALHVITADRKSASNRIVMVSNFLAGVLLICDYLTYTFDGGSTSADYYGIRIVNFLEFVLWDVVLFVYAMYVSNQLFGTSGLKGQVLGRKRIRAIYIMSFAGVLLVIAAQFSDFLYYFDKFNVYHRGRLFFINNIIPAVGLVLLFTVIIQYRKKIEKIKFLTLLMFIILPSMGMALQIKFYGFSFSNIAIGFTLLMMFVENSILQSREILHVSKLEVRTGLFNEHGCIEELYSLRKRSRLTSYTAVFFDICKFSEINRKYGMKAGDQVLKEYAQKLQKITESKEILARQGSDHFVVIVKKENLEKILDFLKGTDIEFSYGFKEDKKAKVKVSAIAGVYEIDDEKIKGEDILANAYTALLYAKTVSKKPVDYMTSELKEKIDKERLYGSMLLEGVEKGEFAPFYQPKVDIENNKLCGAEALARWFHGGDIITPGDFIPVMEKNDSICALDFYILKKVCEDIKEWLSEGLEIPTISVNFSRRNLVNENLAKDIDEVVCSMGVPKELIEIEITETNDEFPLGVLKGFVRDLHDLGYKVAVDDFGCGAASLSLLREADFDTLKIDKSFIDNAFEKDITILTHIVNLAKAMDMKIVAEGVENERQQETLQGLGVGIVQGFFFDRAVPKEEIVKRISNKEYAK